MSSSSLSTYLDYQVYAANMPQSLSRVASEAAVKSAQSYYTANIGKVTSVDGFLNNYKLFSYAMTASGLQDMTYAKAFMRKVLTSDLTDPTSFVNKLTDTRFKAFAQQFTFTTKGTVTGNPVAQSATQESNTVALYTAKTGSSSVNGVLATAYYEQHIGKVKSVKDLENDSQLLDYVMTAYGLDTNTIDKGTYTQSTNAQNDLAAVLESDATDANSVANQMAAGNVATANIPIAVQSQASQDATSAAYTKLHGRTSELINYESKTTGIGSVHSIDAFLANSKLVSVAEKAYGIDPAAYSTSDLKRILTSNLDEPMSVANQLGPKAVAFAKAFSFTTSSSSTSPYTQLAQDFNFDATGAVATTRTVQSTISVAATETLYMSRAKSDKASQAAAKTETSYYTSAITGAETLDDVMSDTRVLSYLKTAYGLDPKTSSATMRQILTSDLSNPKSVASAVGGSARQMAAAFNFTTAGTVARTGGTAQSAKNVQVMNDAYLRQTMEDEAGDTNEGVKLALYFQRKASSGAITSAYSILADSALLKVVRTALNIPASSANQDIDLQAKQITNRLNLTDLQDPTKLKKFISQFATLYDLGNSTSSSDTITSLFG